MWDRSATTGPAAVCITIHASNNAADHVLGPVHTHEPDMIMMIFLAADPKSGGAVRQDERGAAVL